MSITLTRDNLKGFVEKKDLEKILPDIERAHQALHKKTGLGKE